MSRVQSQQTGQAVTTQEDAASILDEIIKVTRPQDEREAERTKTYFRRFLGEVVKPGQIVSDDVELNIKHWIGEIDKSLSAQLNEVMHHPDFQKMEGTWRGLHYLIQNSETSENLKIRVLNVTKDQLSKDLEKAIEFDQSSLFKKIYEEEFGQLGGKPYGMLVGDYQFGRSPQDISLLSMISQVCAAAHSPFVASASPKMFNMDRFDEMPKPRDLAKIFDSVEFAAWKSFRESEDSRYAALTLPRVLSRLPYGEAFKKVTEFNFEEAVDGKDHDKYAWMNSAWAYATRITDAVAKWGWMARTRGVEAGGKVEGLPVHTFPTDDGDVAMKCPTEIAISDRREFELSNLGFLPLLHNKDTDNAVFMGAQSCQKPAKYYDPAASSNAELSAKFNLLMCTSRFAHYLKVMARDRVGSFMEASDCERWLNDWIRNYCVDPNGASDATRAQRPLSEARVDVKSVEGRPGWYTAVAYLRPHFQMETLTTSMRLVAELPPPAG
jgi:type VI secretion system protein ImpC